MLHAYALVWGGSSASNLLETSRTTSLRDSKVCSVLNQIWLKYTTLPELVDYAYMLLHMPVLAISSTKFGLVVYLDIM